MSRIFADLCAAQVSAPILFLDLDGVLNSRRYFRDTFDGSDHDGLTWEQAQIDPAAVAILSGVLEATGAVVVDDDADMAHLAHRLVRTSMDVGLTEADASRLIALLGGPR